MSNDDWEKLIAKNGLWCDIDMFKYAHFNNKYINIEGKFDCNSRGHMGLWSGSVVENKRVWLSPLRKKAAQQGDAPGPASPSR